MKVSKFFKNRIITNNKSGKKFRFFNEPRIIHIITHLYNCERFFTNKDLVRYLKVMMFKTAVENNVALLEVGCDFTHCHMIIKVYKGQNVFEIINNLKGKVSRSVRKRFDYLNEYPHFWAKGYYAKVYKENENKNLFKYVRNQAKELINESE